MMKELRTTECSVNQRGYLYNVVSLHFDDGGVLDLDVGDLFFGTFELYKDEDENIEFYVPENEYHTGFYLKFPNDSQTKYTN